MTKNEKKEIIRGLFQEIENTSNINEYSLKRSQLFDEVLNSGYSEESIEGVKYAVHNYCKDFDMNMEILVSNQPQPNDEHFMTLSKTGLLTLIDTSLLPD